MLFILNLENLWEIIGVDKKLSCPLRRRYVKIYMLVIQWPSPHSQSLDSRALEHWARVMLMRRSHNSMYSKNPNIVSPRWSSYLRTSDIFCMALYSPHSWSHKTSQQCGVVLCPQPTQTVRENYWYECTVSHASNIKPLKCTWNLEVALIEVYLTSWLVLGTHT
jgi:hypothetical protein